MVMVTATGCANGNDVEKENKEFGVVQAGLPKDGDEIAVITTNRGELRMMFYPEEAPKAVENFKTHAKEGYFNGLTFHRVINEFMVQGGDPTATGMGGESIWGEPFEDEISPKLHFFRGAVAMANAGPNTNGSQFFIVQAHGVDEQAVKALEEAKESNEQPSIKIGENNVVQIKDIFTNDVMKRYKEQGGAIQLEYAFGNPYTIFGQVYEGLETVDAIANVKTGAEDKPLEDVVIQKIEFEAYQAK